MTNLSTIDLTIVITWLLGMMALGIWISRKSEQDTAQDYFLASKSLPWWAVGGSLIASNISAEQFIGMSGAGFASGMAIAAYELMAAITLLVVAKYFLPVFIKAEIYTMPQFLEKRFDHRVRLILSIFWVFLFIFVNITSVLYLGSLAINKIMGIPIFYAIVGLAVYSATFSVTGGLKAVVWTDVVQVVVLIFGGLVSTYMVLNAVGGGFFSGLETLVAKAPDKFDMILDRSNPEYSNLPGISVLIGGMWIANLYYWGNNQYIIQRALASKSIAEAQKGTAFAAMVKVILPIIVVVPGIAAYVLNADIAKPDEAYPWVLSNYVGVGFKGIALAALIAAIGSSISSMVNSAATIFTLDIYRPLWMKQDIQQNQLLNTDQHDRPQLTVKEENHLVRVGKLVSLLCIIIGVIIAPSLGSLDQAFQYIQEYTGFVSPGIVAVFLLGMFWKRTSTKAALTAVILAIPVSLIFKFGTPWIPFMNRMGLSFLLLSAVIIVISMIDNKRDDRKAIYFESSLFKTSNSFNFMGSLVVLAVAAIYYFFW